MPSSLRFSLLLARLSTLIAIQQWNRWRKTRVAALLALLIVTAAWKFQSLNYDSRKWSSDYSYALKWMNETYANLDRAAEKGSPDLKKLNGEVIAALGNARSDDEARTILRGFVRAFGDGHLFLLPADRPSGDLEPAPDVLLSRFTRSEIACAAGLTGGPAGQRFSSEFLTPLTG